MVFFQKDGAINLDEYKSKGTHWIVIFVKNDVVTYFHSFRLEHIPKGIGNSQAIKIEKNV